MPARLRFLLCAVSLVESLKTSSLVPCSVKQGSITSLSSLTMASSAASTPLNPGGDALPIMVHVTAPATLPAGYTFEAELNGDPALVFNCEVVRFLLLLVKSDPTKYSAMDEA